MAANEARRNNMQYSITWQNILAVDGTVYVYSTSTTWPYTAVYGHTLCHQYLGHTLAMHRAQYLGTMRG